MDDHTSVEEDNQTSAAPAETTTTTTTTTTTLQTADVVEDDNPNIADLEFADCTQSTCMENAVIIYDTGSQEQQIIKFVSDPESVADQMQVMSSEDPDNIITLHASSEDNPQSNQSIGNDDPSLTVVQNQQQEQEQEQQEDKETEDPDTDDDETIATFVTSSGQQLALYAVEDSEEIFAVAVYDETGAPPTNFHFLLKADVERLIGEGAVKTVKKPSAMKKPAPEEQEKKKKQLEEVKFPIEAVTNKSTTTIVKKEAPEPQADILETIVETIEIGPTPGSNNNKVQQSIVQKVATPKTTQISKVAYVAKSTSRQQTPPKITRVVPTIRKISDPSPTRRLVKTFEYNKNAQNVATPTRILPKSNRFMAKDDRSNKITYLVTHPNKPFAIENVDELDSDVEILEQSTVQYILCGDDGHSDTELTFDELQRSLRGFHKAPQKKVYKPSPAKSLLIDRKKDNILKYTSSSSPTKIIKSSPVVVIQSSSHSPKKSRSKNNILQSHRKIKKEVEDEFPFDPQPTVIDSTKVKRCRKQQLTVVNRADSEIIIQPAALMYSESEDEPRSSSAKKRGRRKKRASPDPDYNPNRAANQRKAKKRSVELIEIDVDERDSLNKGKGSSDKENDNDEVQLLGEDEDTEDEEDDELRVHQKKSHKIVMSCHHCGRNFRKRKVLEGHLQICLKVPGNAQKLEEKRQAMLLLNKDKRFKCKNCEEHFDMAVSLARHVRVVHSPRKKSRLSLNQDANNKDRNDKDDDKSSTTTTTELEDDDEDDYEDEDEYEPKRRGRPPANKKSVVGSEPRRRGRPSLKGKVIPPPAKDRSITPDAPESVDRISPSVKLESQPARKRGRPPFKKIVAISQDNTHNSPTRTIKDASPAGATRADRGDESSEPEGKVVQQVPRKRGRPPFKKVAPIVTKEASEEEDVKEPLVQPLKKRGRPSKRPSVDASPASPVFNVAESEKIVETQITPIQIPKKRGRPSFKPETNFVVVTTSTDASTSTNSVAESETSVRVQAAEEKGTTDSLLADLEREDDDDQPPQAAPQVEVPKKRGRPPKDTASNEPPLKIHKPEEEVEQEDDDEEEDQNRDQLERLLESIVEPKKRGRPPKVQTTEELQEQVAEFIVKKKTRLSSASEDKLEDKTEPPTIDLNKRRGSTVRKSVDAK